MLTKKETIVILSTFAAITVIFGSIYLWSSRLAGWSQKQKGTEQPLSVLEQPGSRTITNIKIPETVNAYNGVVVKLGNGYLSIKAMSHNNYLARDQILEIHFNGSTKIYKRVLPKAIGPDVRFVAARERLVSKEDFKLGDMVQVYSYANIKNSQSFKADIIKILEF